MFTHDFGKAFQQLREDHARISSSTQQRSVSDGSSDLRHLRTVRNIQLAAHGLHRQVHVRSRITIRDWIDVQGIDLILVDTQPICGVQKAIGQLCAREFSDVIHGWPPLRVWLSARSHRVWKRQPHGPEPHRVRCPQMFWPRTARADAHLPRLH
jgi:hypothetical protein